MYDFLMKCVLLGDKNVGKSTLLQKFIPKNMPTIGVDFVSNDIRINHHKIRCHIWDTSGDINYINIIRSYLRNSVVALVVFDLSNPQSFDNVDFWIKEFCLENPNYKKICIIGTHFDHPRKVSFDMIQYKCSKMNIQYFEINPEFNIQHILLKIGSQIMNDYTNMPFYFFGIEGFKENQPQTSIVSSMDYQRFDTDEWNGDNEPCKKYCLKLMCWI